MSANPGVAIPNKAADPRPASRDAAQRKPRFSAFIATACGLGYIPVAPGTWGSLGGLLLYAAVQIFFLPPILVAGLRESFEVPAWSAAWAGIPIAAFIALLGVWTTDRYAKYLQAKDPQRIVIDEVSGQFLVCSLGVAGLNWKYLLLGFILFRVFDIWKPFPVRQAESLPAGWGIMADDWVAGLYAAIGLWIARSLGL
jgi:phosphatidylglycerophosphatase A